MIFLSDLPQYLNQTITTLEYYSEPEAWTRIFGPRLFAMLTRYMNNDVVIVGFGVYAYSVFSDMFQRGYQAVWERLLTLFYATIMIEHGDPIFGCVSEFLSEKTSQLPRLSEAVARAQWEGEDSDDEDGPNPQRPRVVLGPPLGQVNTITYKGYRLEVSRYKSNDSGNSFDDPFSRLLPQTEYISVRIRFGSMATLKGILEEWKDMYYDKKYGKCIVYRYLLQPWAQWEWDASIVKVPRRFETVVMKDGQKETLLKDIKTFLSQGEWFQKRGIPYRRGYLLYGPPGTGKTSTIEAIAGELHMNVSIVSLTNDLDDNRFLSCLQRKPRNSILLIEDVDSVKMSTNDHETDLSKTSHAGVSLSSLLNALDGIVGQEGSVVFMTCNDTSKLPPALLRPGRVDMKLHMGLADEFQIRHMYRRFFDETTTVDLECLVKLLPKDEIAPAELQNFFMIYSLQNDSNKNICDGVDDFLEDVRKDREQARQHAERTKQKRDIYGNLSSAGTPPPTPAPEGEGEVPKTIVLNVQENGQLCLAQS